MSLEKLLLQKAKKQGESLNFPSGPVWTNLLHSLNLFYLQTRKNTPHVLLPPWHEIFDKDKMDVLYALLLITGDSGNTILTKREKETFNRMLLSFKQRMGEDTRTEIQDEKVITNIFVRH